MLSIYFGAQYLNVTYDVYGMIFIFPIYTVLQLT